MTEVNLKERERQGMDTELISYMWDIREREDGGVQDREWREFKIPYLKVQGRRKVKPNYT